MNRIKGILAAGTLTGVVLITVLVLGFGNLNAQPDNAQSTPNVVEQPVTMPDSSITAVSSDQAAAQELQSLQAYNQQLEAALQIMQEREAIYQAQLEQANRTVLQLQDQLNAQIQAQPSIIVGQAAPSTSFSSHERSEHESHEGFEFDDD
ncbi:MAG: hypothetical protein KC441_11465 [Anaerolineales bacterium]|nr:hypothetical protein [Anaerolineales bacterium]